MAVLQDKRRGATGRKNFVFAAAPSALHQPLAGPGGSPFPHLGLRGFPGILSSEGALSLDSRMRVVILFLSYIQKLEAEEMNILLKIFPFCCKS